MDNGKTIPSLIFKLEPKPPPKTLVFCVVRELIMDVIPMYEL